jgi:hypothetical protein
MTPQVDRLLGNLRLKRWMIAARSFRYHDVTARASGLGYISTPSGTTNNSIETTQSNTTSTERPISSTTLTTHSYLHIFQNDSRQHFVSLPTDAALKACTLQKTVTNNLRSKQSTIEERKSNLPLPEQPPQASDWQSSDARNVNVGSGSTSGNTTRDPATADSSVRTDGQEFKVASEVGGARQGHDNLGGLPSDAVTKEARGKAGLADTMGKDYGYPQKNDPSSGIKQ